MHSDLLALKLHVDNKGIVWYSSTNGPPINTNKNVMSFLMSPICNELHRYRLMATHDNVQLILALFLRRLQTGIGIVEVCGPLVCDTEAERNSPEHVLYAIRQVQHVSSLGGWHVFNKFEYPAYALHSHLKKLEGKVDDHAHRLLRSHPVWPALSFIPHLDLDAICKLMGEILDPRWFLSFRNPNRGSRLRKYLGLDKTTMLGLMDLGPEQRNQHRLQLVIDSVSGPVGAVSDKHPRNFLKHLYEKRCKTKDGFQSRLRMLQTFVEYLRLTWLAALGATAYQTEALFVPEHFFKDEFEVAAWRQHMKKTLGERDG